MRLSKVCRKKTLFLRVVFLCLLHRIAFGIYSKQQKIDQVLGSVGKTEEHRHRSSKLVKRCPFNTRFTLSCHVYNSCRDGVILVAQISNVLSNKRNKTLFSRPIVGLTLTFIRSLEAENVQWCSDDDSSRRIWLNSITQLLISALYFSIFICWAWKCNWGKVPFDFKVVM